MHSLLRIGTIDATKGRLRIKCCRDGLFGIGWSLGKIEVWNYGKDTMIVLKILIRYYRKPYETFGHSHVYIKFLQLAKWNKTSEWARENSWKCFLKMHNFVCT